MPQRYVDSGRIVPFRIYQTITATGDTAEGPVTLPEAKTNVLEIHNRPNYIKQIKNVYNGKIFLYFHNDPLSMDGSKSIEQRKKLLKREKI